MARVPCSRRAAPPISITDTLVAGRGDAALHEAADAAVLHRDDSRPARPGCPASAGAGSSPACRPRSRNRSSPAPSCSTPRGTTWRTARQLWICCRTKPGKTDRICSWMSSPNSSTDSSRLGSASAELCRPVGADAAAPGRRRHLAPSAMRWCSSMVAAVGADQHAAALGQAGDAEGREEQCAAGSRDRCPSRSRHRASSCWAAPA